MLKNEYIFGHKLGTFQKILGTFWDLSGAMNDNKRLNSGTKKPPYPLDLSRFLVVFACLNWFKNLVEAAAI